MQQWSPDAEVLLPTPPSKQRQTKDWTGKGAAVDGLASYSLWNGALHKLFQQEDLVLLDFEYRGFKWVGKSGWDRVCVSNYGGERFETSNHPQYEAGRTIYGGLMETVADLYHGNALPMKYAVLRGSTI